MPAGRQGFNPFGRFREAFHLAGSIWMDSCPVCSSTSIAELWRLPQNRLPKKAYLDCPGTSLDRLYLNHLPTLRTPQEVFCFDICGHCESVFLNPRFDDAATYAGDLSKVESFFRLGLEEFRKGAGFVTGLFPDRTATVVDAACGAGQTLALLKEMHPSLRLIGLDLSHPSVQFLKAELGIEAYEVDLDHSIIDPLIKPGTVDFVIMQEAFEHLSAPVSVMQKMMRLLRPGGRMHFTAQYYGDTDLQIRPGEPIYINDVGFDYVLHSVGGKLLDLRRDVKIRATIEKTADGQTASEPWAPRRGFPEARLVLPPSPPRPWPSRALSVMRKRLGLGGTRRRR